MKKILISGGNGFVGSNLTKRLLEDKHEITITSNGETNLKVRKILYSTLNGVDWKYINGQDIVFHQMANNNTRCLDMEEMLNANVYGPIKLFKLALEGGCKKFIYASSTAVYGNSSVPYTEETPICPLIPYAESKAMFDDFAMKFALENNVSVIGLRYCNIYGPGEEHKGKMMSMIGQILNNVLSNKPIKLFKNGEQKRDWVYIKDVVEANLLAMNSEKSGIYNIGSRKAHSFNEIIEIISKIMNKKIEIEYIDCPFPEEYQSHTECCINKANLDLGFSPRYDIILGIKDYLKSILTKNNI